MSVLTHYPQVGCQSYYLLYTPFSQQLFHDVVDVRCKQGAKLYLVGVVCYYGKHYSTFFYHSKMKSWVSFDDANVKEVGNHSQHLIHSEDISSIL